jgi:hypothetical protein
VIYLQAFFAKRARGGALETRFLTDLSEESEGEEKQRKEEIRGEKKRQKGKEKLKEERCESVVRRMVEYRPLEKKPFMVERVKTLNRDAEEENRQRERLEKPPLSRYNNKRDQTETDRWSLRLEIEKSQNPPLFVLLFLRS